jgi:hypothetical protein
MAKLRVPSMLPSKTLDRESLEVDFRLAAADQIRHDPGRSASLGPAVRAMPAVEKQPAPTRDSENRGAVWRRAAFNDKSWPTSSAMPAARILLPSREIMTLLCSSMTDILGA